MGNKLERQNKHQRNLKKKIRKFERKGWSTEGLNKELSYSTGEIARPEFTTGHAAGDEKSQQKFAMKKLEKRIANQT